MPGGGKVNHEKYTNEGQAEKDKLEAEVYEGGLNFNPAAMAPYLN
jgi:hypothetical protein